MILDKGQKDAIERALRDTILLAGQYIEEYGPTHSGDADILEKAAALLKELRNHD